MNGVRSAPGRSLGCHWGRDEGFYLQNILLSRTEAHSYVQTYLYIEHINNPEGTDTEWTTTASGTLLDAASALRPSWVGLGGDVSSGHHGGH